MEIPVKLYDALEAAGLLLDGGVGDAEGTVKMKVVLFLIALSE